MDSIVRDYRNKDRPFFEEKIKQITRGHFNKLDVYLKSIYL
jgi:hypothetical protein